MLLLVIELKYSVFTDDLKYSVFTDKRCINTVVSLYSDGTGGWSSEGCSTNSTEGGATVCLCNHTTNFAILMRPYTPVLFSWLPHYT